MVRFVDNAGDGADASRNAVTSADAEPGKVAGTERLAPVTYLSRAVDPGAGSGRARPSARSGARATAENDDHEQLTPREVEEALVRALARRPLSESEVLEQAIKKYELEPAQANDILDHLRDLGYVNDTALAEHLRYTLSERKGQSRAIVARTMATRGIDRDVIAEVLDEIADDSELAQATELAAKRLSTLSRFDRETIERRLVGYLARRGYPGGIARQAIAAALSTQGRSGVAFR